MTHVVHHLDVDGNPVWLPADDLEHALEQVEHLQHSGTTGLRVFGEVPIRIETIYRVSVAAVGPVEEAPDEAGTTDEDDRAVEAAVAEPAVEASVVAEPEEPSAVEPADEAQDVVAVEPAAPPASIDTADEDAILAAVGAVDDVGDVADEGDEGATPDAGVATEAPEEAPADEHTAEPAAAVAPPPGSALLGPPPGSAPEPVAVDGDVAANGVEASNAAKRGIFGRG